MAPKLLVYVLILAVSVRRRKANQNNSRENVSGLKYTENARYGDKNEMTQSNVHIRDAS